MHHKHLASNLRKWFEFYLQSKQIPGQKEAELAELTYVNLSTNREGVNWFAMYQWMEQHGTPDIDFYLYWHGNVAHTYFRDEQVALMFKLRWI